MDEQINYDPQIVSLWNGGETLRSIAEKLPVSHEFVRKRLRVMGESTQRRQIYRAEYTCVRCGSKFRAPRHRSTCGPKCLTEIRSLRASPRPGLNREMYLDRAAGMSIREIEQKHGAQWASSKICRYAKQEGLVPPKTVWESTQHPNRDDQFFTLPKLARILVGRILDKECLPDNPLFVEPCAGDGAFVRPLLNAGHPVRAIDLYPRKRGTIKGDFLADDLIKPHPSLVFLGTPPFSDNMAAKFYNRAAELDAKMIAFVLPSIFRAFSTQGCLDLDKRFVLVHDEPLPPNSFLRNGKSYSVPSTFQIWARGGRS